MLTRLWLLTHHVFIYGWTNRGEIPLKLWVLGPTRIGQYYLSKMPYHREDSAGLASQSILFVCQEVKNLNS